jgi:hypothetical protein
LADPDQRPGLADPDPYPFQPSVSKLSVKWSGMFIPDPGSEFFSSFFPDLNPESRGKKSPDPQHWDFQSGTPDLDPQHGKMSMHPLNLS